MERKFVRGERELYSNDEKRAIGELVKKFKGDYDAAVVTSASKTKYAKKRLMFPIYPRKGMFVAPAVRIIRTQRTKHSTIKILKLRVKWPRMLSIRYLNCTIPVFVHQKSACLRWRT